MRDNPFFLHMLGIPGAGKTTFLERFLSRWADMNPGVEAPVLLGFDQVMQAMPEYQAMDDKVAAFSCYEIPAREEGYKKLQQLLATKQSFLFDNGGSAASHVDILRDATGLGYRVILVSVVAPIAVVKARVDVRAVAEGRHTPLQYLEDRADKIAALKATYRALTPHFYEIENAGADYASFCRDCDGVAKSVFEECLN